MPFDKKEVRRIAFLVDGKCERALEERLDKKKTRYSFIRRDKNGSSVSASAIAQECVSIMKMSGRLHSTTLIIVDKEDRTVSAPELEIRISELIKAQISFDFEVIVADMMFENWIVADIEGVSSEHSALLDSRKNSKENEGKNACTYLNNIWKDSTCKYSSDKVGNSRRLFMSVRLGEAQSHSPSFERLVHALTKHGIKIY